MNVPLLLRTMGPLLAVGTLALLAGMFAASQIQSIHQRGDRIVSENLASIRAAESTEATIMELRYRLKRYLSNKNERHLEEIEKLLPNLHRLQLEIRRSAATDTELASYRMITDGMDQLKSELLKLDSTDESSASSTSSETVGVISDDMIPVSIVQPLQAYIRENEKQLAEKNDRNHATADRLAIGFITLGVLGGLAGLISGYLIARRVNSALVQLSVPVRSAAGALHQVAQPIQLPQGGDFESLEAMLQEVETHVREVVTRLQQSERDVLKTEQLAAMGQMAAGLGHELRNPLTSIKAILQLAEEPSQLTDRDLSILKQEMGRLEHGLQSFLEFAKPACPVKRQNDILPAVLQTLALVARRAESKDVLLSQNIKDQRLWGLVDISQIRQVTLNLLSNAIEAVPVGGRVHVECHQVVQPSANANAESALVKTANSWCELRIQDNGPGLPKDLGGTIFDPFVSTKDAGLGLGLSICKRIIELHDGTLIGRDVKQLVPLGGSPRTRDGTRLDLLDGAEFIVRLPLMPLHSDCQRKNSCTT